jgi:hypothetical protein
VCHSRFIHETKRKKIGHSKYYKLMLSLLLVYVECVVRGRKRNRIPVSLCIADDPFNLQLTDIVRLYE